MLSHARRQAGVTLIELMVGVTLIAIVMALGVPTFRTAVENRQIRTAAESIQTGLLVARTEALRRNRQVAFTPGTGTGWQVGCSPEDTTVGADGAQACPAVLQTRMAEEGSSNATLTTTETVASTGAAASSPMFGGSLVFTQLGRVASTSLGAGNLATYLVTNPNGGTCAKVGGEMRCLAVVVSTAGQVRMCDPAVTAATDPRKC